MLKSRLCLKICQRVSKLLCWKSSLGPLDLVSVACPPVLHPPRRTCADRISALPCPLVPVSAAGRWRQGGGQCICFLGSHFRVDVAKVLATALAHLSGSVYTWHLAALAHRAHKTQADNVNHRIHRACLVPARGWGGACQPCAFPVLCPHPSKSCVFRMLLQRSPSEAALCVPLGPQSPP